MKSIPIHSSIRFAVVGLIIPSILWGAVKSVDYGVVGGSVGSSMDNWAFQILIMLAPLFYHIVATLQDQSLIVAYVAAFGTNAVLYAVIGVLSKWLMRFPLIYYLFVGLLVTSMLMGTDSWFFYRWLNREEFNLPLTLNELDLRYFVVTASLVVVFFVATISKKKSNKGNETQGQV